MITLQPVYDSRGDVIIWHVAGDNPFMYKAELINTTASDDFSRFIVDIKPEDLSLDLDSIFTVHPSSIILAVGTAELSQEGLVEGLQFLKDKGYGICFSGLDIDNIAASQKVLRLSEIAFIADTAYVSSINQVLSKAFPYVAVGCQNIESLDEILQLSNICTYFTGTDFSVREFCQDEALHPMSFNYTELVRVVNQPDFDFKNVSDIVGRDPSLSVNLVSMANKVAANKGISSVQQAAAMLGQKELKRWINVSVVNEMCADSPGEVMRLSLMRARFLENLAPFFGFVNFTGELFLLGLFSTLDIMLAKDMNEALDEVGVSDDIREALVDRSGKYGIIYSIILAYERMDYDYIKSTDYYDDGVLTAGYLDALTWYGMVISGR